MQETSLKLFNEGLVGWFLRTVKNLGAKTENR